MKYIAIIDTDEKPVSCEFIGCNGNVTPYLIGTTTDIKALEQEPILDKIRAEIKNLKRFEIRGEKTALINGDNVLQIIDKYKANSEVE